MGGRQGWERQSGSQVQRSGRSVCREHGVRPGQGVSSVTEAARKWGAAWGRPVLRDPAAWIEELQGQEDQV